MLTSNGATSFEINLIGGLSKTETLKLKNSGASSKKIDFTCQNTLGKICKYITFNNKTFNLPLAKGVYKYEDFIIKLPKDFPTGKYSAAIIATDKDKNNAIVSLNVDVKSGAISNLLVKLTSDIPTTNIPYALLFIFMLIFLTTFLSQTFFKKNSGGVALSFVVSFILGIIIIEVI